MLPTHTHIQTAICKDCSLLSIITISDLRENQVGQEQNGKAQSRKDKQCLGLITRGRQRQWSSTHPHRHGFVWSKSNYSPSRTSIFEHACIELQRDVHLLWRRHTAQLTCDEMWRSWTRPSLIVTRWMPMRDRDCMCSTLPAINSEAFRRGALCLQTQHKQLTCCLSSTVTFRNVINQTVQQQMSYENKRAIKLCHRE